MARDEDAYNGWTNYATWNVKLWINNSEGDSETFALYARDAVLEHCETNDDGELVTPVDDSEKNEAAEQLAKQIEEWVDEQTPSDASCITDILRAALADIDYNEIAWSMINDAIEALS